MRFGAAASSFMEITFDQAGNIPPEADGGADWYGAGGV